MSPRPGNDWFEIDVTLRRVSDGATRSYRTAELRNAWRYQWSEGNYGCDCNRALFFARAGSEPEPEDIPCGESRFAVERVVDVETGLVLCLGEPAWAD